MRASPSSRSTNPGDRARSAPGRNRTLTRIRGAGAKPIARQGFEFPVDGGEFVEGVPERPVADRLPDVRGAICQTGNGQRKPRRFLQSALFVDEITAVESEKNLARAGQRAVGATGDV